MIDFYALLDWFLRFSRLCNNIFNSFVMINGFMRIKLKILFDWKCVLTKLEQNMYDYLPKVDTKYDESEISKQRRPKLKPSDSNGQSFHL